MKRTSVFLLCLLCWCAGAGSADATFAITDETLFRYTLMLNGQKRALSIKVDQVEHPLLLQWSSPPYEGEFLIPDVAVENANQMYFEQPFPFRQIKLAENETLFCLISRKAYSELKEHGYFAYNDTVYHLKQMATDINYPLQDEHSLKVLHVIDEIDGWELWILDDSEFPLICRMNHNPRGIDFRLNTIESSDL